MEPLIGLDQVSVLYDGTLTSPRLSHPEGLAVAADQAVWCGGDRGEIFRISPDGGELELMASTGGFALGMAFDRRGDLYVCDLKHAAVFRLESSSGQLRRFAAPRDPHEMRIPNWPVVDDRRGCVYVSDSHDAAEAGPGIWRFDLETGDGDLWYDRPLTFANGMALGPDGDELFVVETFAQRVVAFPIEPDGSPGEPRVVVEDIERVPDGVAFDRDGRLYISCYEPSRIYRYAEGNLDLFVDDPEAHTLCHPTNCAFRGSDLLTSNLGRWHISVVPTDSEGLPLLPDAGPPDRGART